VRQGVKVWEVELWIEEEEVGLQVEEGARLLEEVSQHVEGEQLLEEKASQHVEGARLEEKAWQYAEGARLLEEKAWLPAEEVDAWMRVVVQEAQMGLWVRLQLQIGEGQSMTRHSVRQGLWRLLDRQS
jgi:hypothetical protein